MTVVKRGCFRAANRYSPDPLTLHLVRIWGMIPKRGSRLSEGSCAIAKIGPAIR